MGMLCMEEMSSGSSAVLGIMSYKPFHALQSIMFINLL